MSPIFKNVTTYATKEYKEFLEFHGKKHNFSYLSLTFAFSLFLILCSVIQFTSNHSLLGILFIFLLLIFLVYQILHPLQLVKKEVKSGKISDNAQNTFSFFDRKFKIRNKDGVSIVKYSKLYKVYETETFFYLYLNSTYAFLVSKGGFIIGNEKQFANFLKKKIWFKYKKEK